MNHIMEGVFKLHVLSNLQVHKVMGPDELPTRLLKELGLNAYIDSHLLDLSDQGTLPSNIKESQYTHALGMSLRQLTAPNAQKSTLVTFSH